MSRKTIRSTPNRKHLFGCKIKNPLNYLFVALTHAVKEILVLKQMWRFMLPGKGMPCCPVFEDNQGAVQFAQNPVTNSNSKHFDVRHRFLENSSTRGTSQ